MRAFIFPGQGSQSVGMGSALAAASAHAREVFQEVDDALGQNLSRLMAEGPEDQLTLTENAQPALMATSMMPHRVNWMTPGMQSASLDHALWIHEPLRADEWLLYATDSPWAGTVPLSQYRPPCQSGSEWMAARPTSWKAMFWAL